jgi:hypothetical protein
MKHLITLSILELLILIIGLVNIYTGYSSFLHGVFTVKVVINIIVGVICIQRFLCQTMGLCPLVKNNGK